MRQTIDLINRKKKQLQNNSPTVFLFLSLAVSVHWHGMAWSGLVCVCTLYIQHLQQIPTNARQCQTRHTNETSLELIELLNSYSNWHQFYCTDFGWSDARIYSSIGEDTWTWFFIPTFQSNWSIQTLHASCFSFFFFIFRLVSSHLFVHMVDHYAFSLPNNQDKSYLTFAIWSANTLALSLSQYHVPPPDWNLSGQLRYHSRSVMQ